MLPATLARVVGKSCSVDLLIDEIFEELRSRPYEPFSVAGGWKHLTRQVCGRHPRQAQSHFFTSRPRYPGRIPANNYLGKRYRVWYAAVIAE